MVGEPGSAGHEPDLIESVGDTPGEPSCRLLGCKGTTEPALLHRRENEHQRQENQPTKSRKGSEATSPLDLLERIHT